MQQEELKKLLDLLKSFGFDFYGNDEEGKPLLVAPNKQIVPIQLAIEFVKKKRSEMENSNSSSVEQISFTNSLETLVAPDIESSIESHIENSIEKGVNTIETNIEKQDNFEKTSTNQSKSKSAKADNNAKQNDSPQIDMPIGVGYLPSSFDPLHPSEVKKFINHNKGVKSTKSAAWLKELWEKFLIEQGFSDGT